MHGPCMASHALPLNILRKTQGQKLKDCISKYGKLAYFQNVVNLYLTQAYNAIPAL